MYIEKDELTIYEVEDFHTQLLKEFENESVIIDMKNVTKIDMSNIQLLVSTQKSCYRDSKTFRLENITENVAKILNNCACSFLLGANDE